MKLTVMGNPSDRERLAEGYRKYAERSRKIAEEFQYVSTEADHYLGPPLDWDEERVESINSDTDETVETRK